MAQRGEIIFAELFADLIGCEKMKEDIESIQIRKRKRTFVIILSLTLLLLITIIICLTMGSVKIPAATVFRILFSFEDYSSSGTIATIVKDVRLPRILLAAIVGSSLSISGCAMQGLFRNPMASPYIIGVSSGAAFGASLAILLVVKYSFAVNFIPIFAFVFALLTVYFGYSISKEDNKVSVETLILAGVAIMTFFTAMVSLIQYMAGDELRSIVFWTMGGLWQSKWADVVTTFPIIFVGTLVVLFFARDLNIMLLGEGHAIDLGINTDSVKTIVLVFSSLITATAVSVSGIIGFVGLIMPHITRIFVGPDHRLLLPASSLSGAIFLIWADTLARTIIRPSELPVGIITAAFGAPFFLYLLKKRKKLSRW